jgi:hypothetical protein
LVSHVQRDWKLVQLHTKAGPPNAEEVSQGRQVDWIARLMILATIETRGSENQSVEVKEITTAGIFIENGVLILIPWHRVWEVYTDGDDAELIARFVAVEGAGGE